MRERRYSQFDIREEYIRMESGAVSSSPSFSEYAAFHPAAIRNLVLPNRIVMAPMTRRKAPEGVVTNDVAAYYARRAAGGVGLIVTEGVQVNNTDAVDVGNTPQCITPAQIAGWKGVVDACRAASNGSSKLCMQIWHTGLYSRTPIGPSGGIDVSNAVRTVPVGRAAEEADILRIAQEFAQMASNAIQQCGFDAVQIHGAHGYFIDSFASPILNQRTDAYGGSPENRAQLAVEIVRAVRTAIGPTVPIIYRFSQWTVTDYQHVKFACPQELEVFLKALVSAGVDAFDVSTRRLTDPGFPAAHPTRSLAAWVKLLLATAAGDTSIPPPGVIAVGSLSVGRMFGEGNPEDAFEVLDPTPGLEQLQRGEIDFLGVGRALLADAEWVKKVQSGGWKSLKPYSTAVLQTLA